MIDPIAAMLGSWSVETGVWSILLRLALSMLFGTIIGCERASKRHAAGLRTFMLVSMASTIAMIQQLGGKAEANGNTLTVCGTGLTGGTVDSVNDHRIAMAAAIASTVCKAPVTILGARCVNKSYPRFWEEFNRLGGHI